MAAIGALAVSIAFIPGAAATQGHPSSARLVWGSFESEGPLIRLVVGDVGTGHSTVLTQPDAGHFDTEPVRSPDGRSVLFMDESDAGVQNMVAEVEHPGTARAIDTGCASVPDCVSDQSPTWAPDGRHFLFTRVMGPFDPVTDDAASALLMIARLDGSHVRRFSEPGNDGSAEEVGAKFAPDGRTVAFIRDQRDASGELHFAIFRMRADGTGVQQLTPWALNADRPSVSPARGGPSAGLVSFETHGGAQPAQGDIALVPLMCPSLKACERAIRLVTHNAGSSGTSYAATWSPDGQHLAYTQEPGTGGVDIWTSRWDGSQARRVTTSGHELWPAWSF